MTRLKCWSDEDENDLRARIHAALSPLMGLSLPWDRSTTERVAELCTDAFVSFEADRGPFAQCTGLTADEVRTMEDAKSWWPAEDVPGHWLLWFDGLRFEARLGSDRKIEVSELPINPRYLPPGSGS